MRPPVAGPSAPWLHARAEAATPAAYAARTARASGPAPPPHLRARSPRPAVNRSADNVNGGSLAHAHQAREPELRKTNQPLPARASQDGNATCRVLCTTSTE